MEKLNPTRTPLNEEQLTEILMAGNKHLSMYHQELLRRLLGEHAYLKQEKVETSDTCIVCEVPLGEPVTSEQAICYNCYHGVDLS